MSGGYSPVNGGIFTAITVYYLRNGVHFDMEKYDLAVLGGGPAGYRAAELASAGGLRTILFEE